jgi:PAS domain S-box-containing protein
MLDITPLKDAERGLREANDELEFGVLARTTELGEANEMMALEIGERKRMEAELREAETRYRLLVEDLPAVVYSWEANWVEAERRPGDGYPYMSPQIEGIVGFTSAEWSETSFWKTRLHPHDRDRVLALASHSEETGEQFNAEYRYLAKDGRVVWVLDRATLRTRSEDGTPATFQGVMLDITGRKAAEEKAAEAEAAYRMLTEQGPVMSYLCRLERDTDPPGLVVEYVSPQIATTVGYPLEHWLEQPERWFEMIHPDDRGIMGQVMENLRFAGEPWANDYRIICGDGRIIWLHDRGQVVARDERGRPTRFQGMLLDVTDARSRLQTLEGVERDLRDLVEGSPAIAWTEVVDTGSGRSRYTYIGPQATEIFGYTPAELMDEPGHFDRMVHPADARRVRATAEIADRELTPWEDEFRVLTRDGSLRVMHATARAGPVDPVARTVTWYGITVDVTAVRRREASTDPERLDRPI